jgi:hypothetical protein
MEPFIARAVDERRHAPGPDRWWAERYRFELVATDGWLGVEFTLLPRLRHTWFVAYWVAPGQPVVLCRDVEVPMPSVPSVLEIRSSALWSHAICEEPLDRWTVAMEAYALRLEPGPDTQADHGEDERGERIGLAFDIEWERTSSNAFDSWGSPAISGPDDVAGYEFGALAYGDIQVGEQTFPVHEAVGRWQHQWGSLQSMEPTGPLQTSLGVAMHTAPSPDTLQVRWAVEGPVGRQVVIRQLTYH